MVRAGLFILCGPKKGKSCLTPGDICCRAVRFELYRSEHEDELVQNFYAGLPWVLIKVKSSVDTTNQTEIRNIASNFYQKLYTSELNGEWINNDILLDGLPQVPERFLAELDARLMMQDLERALQGMECGKAPGLNGMPVEFYKSFWTFWFFVECFSSIWFKYRFY